MNDNNLKNAYNNIENAKKSNIISLKNDGDTYYKQGLYEEALAFYNKALQIDPNNLDILNNKGLALVKLGEIDEAKNVNKIIKELKNRPILPPETEPVIEIPPTRAPTSSSRFCRYCGYELKNEETEICPNCNTRINEMKIGSHCSFCGALIEQGTKFCGNCGNSININSEYQFCNICGKEIKKSLKFCPYCGNPNNESNIDNRVGTKSEQIHYESRNPWLAVLFSFFWPGWGQWYNGRTLEGLKFFGIFIGLFVITLFLPMFLIGLFSNSSTSMMDIIGLLAYFALLYIVFAILLVVIWVYGMYNAYKNAKKINIQELEFNGKSGLFWLPVIVIIPVIFLFIIGAVVDPAGFAGVQQALGRLFLTVSASSFNTIPVAVIIILLIILYGIYNERKRDKK